MRTSGTGEDKLAGTKLEQIGTLPLAPEHVIVFGDTDRDSLNEAILISYGPAPEYERNYLILEEAGGNLYSEEYRGGNLWPYVVADADQDERTDLIGQYGSTLRIYESPSSNTYPTELVWESPPYSNVSNRTAVGDTDRDGRTEILHSENYFGGSSILHILECFGDNDYREVHSIVVPGGVNAKAIADFDRDGFVEIAMFARRKVYVYESHADNEWHLTWSDSTEMDPVSDVTGGVDSDGNGRLELLVFGNGPSSVGWTTIVYEAVCDDQFARITSFSQHDGASGIPYLAIARLEGPRAPISLLMHGYRRIWIYQSTGEGHWELMDEVMSPDPVHSGTYAMDVNRNGRDEVFWTAEQTPTFVLEAPPLTSDAGGAFTQPPRIAVVPNPSRGSIRIHLGPESADRARALVVYDVAGRLVARWAVECRNPPSHDLPSRDLPVGFYLLLIEDGLGRALATTRATVLR